MDAILVLGVAGFLMEFIGIVMLVLDHSGKTACLIVIFGLLMSSLFLNFRVKGMVANMVPEEAIVSDK